MKNLPQKVRSKKLSSRVDLTAMVSVSFLLIIFFMVVGELSKPKIIDLSLPDNGDIVCRPIACVDTNRIYTILLDDKDRIVTYSGLLQDSSVNPKEIIYGRDGIRKELFGKKRAILEYSTSMGKPKNGPIVIIKPSKKSNFKNLVDILDEMAIVKIDTYAIVPEFTPEETKLLASN
ncbi:biopolymer transporter ExbD [Flavobacterium sp. Root935]|uniref:ExbD/TolR family protein n=1 Tax=unclassified Flavobacterium TaxID=196869 RepID=UPI00070BDC57|nr:MULTISPECIES: biopolymer transporter ExbD [unclassified Flavobacterium]KRD57589.1 biopolymer transporter ExbD [Flavobacterium sp. Root935]TDX10218.1 biopolymer transport protein ExbD/TolR [Flavobacterium sp. S87F.05.LMB.W.Kidney.N]